MRVLTILGSPRKKGNTASVLEQFEQILPDGCTVERVNMVDYRVNGCLGCDSCQGRGRGLPIEPHCAQKDDAGAIFEKLMSADLVVYATPVYAWSFSAQLKALLDRLYCMVAWEGQDSRAFMEGIPGMLLATCGGTAAENFDLIQVMFEREMDYLRCPITGQWVLDSCTLETARGAPGAAVARAMAEAAGRLAPARRYNQPQC